MEKKCILPKTEVTKIFEQEPAVLSSLLRFCECTKDELFNVFKLRNTYARKDQSPSAPKDKKEEIYRYGYSQFQHKEGKKTRYLQKPHKSLANIQNILLKRLSYVPTSLASMAGKIGDSPEKNAELHKSNPYLITMDIKNAYPSIDTKRVERNLEAGLDRPLSTWCPLLKTKEQKELFIKAITHLCVSDNQLPQGASTSNQIQNIVMRKVDTEIEMKLGALYIENPVYSRYADDIALSFSEFGTNGNLQGQMDGYLANLEESKMDSDAINEIFKKLCWEPSIYFSNSNEYTLFGDYIKRFREFVEKNSVLSDGDKFVLDRRIDNFSSCGAFGFERDIRDIKNVLFDILGSEGRVLNSKKTKIRTPHSNTDREINGIRFNGQGERTLTKKKLAEYTRLFNDLLEHSVEELASNPFYRGKYRIKLNEEGCLAETRIAILNSIKGVYTRMKNIYGESKIPKDLFILYKVVDLKWDNYDDWTNNKSVYTAFLKRPPKKISAYKKSLSDIAEQQPLVEEPRIPLGTYLKSFEKEILEDPEHDFREAFEDQNIIGHRTVSAEELLRDEVGESESEMPIEVSSGPEIEENGTPPLAKGELPF